MVSQPRYRLAIGGVCLDVVAAPEVDLSAFDERARRYGRDAARRADDVIEVRVLASGETVPTGYRAEPLRGTRLNIETDGLRFGLAAEPGRSVAVVRVGGERVAFENCLRVLVARRLLQQGGALFHAAGLCAGGRGVAFPGESGAGKSTLTLRQEHAHRLGEDLVAVRPAPKGGYLLESVPFLAAHRLDLGPLSVRLVAFAFPHKADRVALGRLGRPETIRRLARTMVSLAPDGLADLMAQRLTELSAAVDAYRIELDLHTRFWPDILEQMVNT